MTGEWTSEEFQDYLETDQTGRKRTKSEKLEADRVSERKPKGSPDHEAGLPEADQCPGGTTIAFVFRISDKRRRDLDNMASTLLDLLVKSGEIEDDRLQIVGTIVSTWVEVEKGKEGVDIWINS